MTKVVLLMSAMLVAGASQAGWEAWLKPSIYCSSCEEYDYGEPLSNEKGVDGGSWGYPAVPLGAEATAASQRGYRQYIKFATEGRGLAFTPDSTGNRPSKSVQVSMFLPGYEEYPSMPETARGGFGLHTPSAGEPSFIGWTADGWQRLQSPAVSPVASQWYDISMKFMQKADGSIRVQYRLKLSTDALYETLHAADDENVVWFPAGNGLSEEIVSRVELHGDGAFRILSGSEPRRGMLISLVPWREMLIDETVDRHESGDWRVFDYNAERWLQRPYNYGDAYVIDVPEGENYSGFLSNRQGADGKEVIEFTVNFTASNENDATPDDVCALVRIVEDADVADIRAVGLGHRFACLVDGGWYTNTTLRADVDADYTVEITLDRNVDEVSYRVREGRGAESGAYQTLVPFVVKMPIGNPLFTFFGGAGKVYGITSSEQEVK